MKVKMVFEVNIELITKMMYTINIWIGNIIIKRQGLLAVNIQKRYNSINNYIVEQEGELPPPPDEEPLPDGEVGGPMPAEDDLGVEFRGG